MRELLWPRCDPRFDSASGNCSVEALPRAETMFKINYDAGATVHMFDKDPTTSDGRGVDHLQVAVVGGRHGREDAIPDADRRQALGEIPPGEIVAVVRAR